MTEWKLIETAPKDGTCVFVFINNRTGKHVVLSKWLGEWCFINSVPLMAEPTHWMPITVPEPPK